MKNYIAYILFAGALAAGFSSCNDFLDENPDNRTTVDSEEKAIDMLVSAYASNQPWFVLELASDNVDDHGGTYGDWSRFYEESFSWNPPWNPTTNRLSGRGVRSIWPLRMPIRCWTLSGKWK